MTLTINGKEEIVANGTTLAALIQEKGLKPAVIVVEYNGTIVKKEEWPNIILKNTDCLEIVAFIGGG
ncbi:MAG TPA: sulfur carrier protein ThiS [Methylomusa anaerophila]|uniref:Sulfur carrier protein ThiS n=1 Tax=Methylomusa anaerophila TaxID=1930071 RepID=A0A348AP11_9FIRM|nr:sulfur carrier protein ThiS [Methylomusa anaerophila]BBB92809.1 sulfur carrier protein ThiS [Methylomusa anaerophila]HML90721.1 sulfur carrier protein ThiS [Methylomusa anaerophila]